MNATPDSNALRELIDQLFGVVETPPCPARDESAFLAALTVERFDIDVPVRVDEPNPVAARDAWLDTPNTAFGGRCPRSFVDGSAEERGYLAGVLQSLRDGAFS